MKRAIVTPAVLSPAALVDLKDWLGIASAGDDGQMTALLRAALETCEGFIGSLPLQAGCEEVLDVAPGWLVLTSRPVQAITGLRAVAADGSRSDLPAGAYAIDLGADGSGRVRLLVPAGAPRVVVRFVAGLAADWAGLPDGLRHGLVRLAAHGYRQRETAEPGALPPAAVAALWRPWRGLRLL